MNKTIESLINIGLNKLEAEVYIYLLNNPGQTAYKIGKQLNKATANVYKAIDKLLINGAVLVEDNKNKQCIAVPPNEFFSQYRLRLKKQTELAEKQLQDLHIDYSNEKSYTIGTPSMVFERFKQMMGRCTTIAVVDAFPKTLEQVKTIIEEATAKGIEVHVEAYSPIEIKGAHVTIAQMGKQSTDHWNSQQLNLVIDGNEHLTALFDNSLEQLKQATWSNNTYLSCMLHAGMLREQGFLQVMQAVDNPDAIKEIKGIINRQKFFFNSDIPGFNKLRTKNY